MSLRKRKEVQEVSRRLGINTGHCQWHSERGAVFTIRGIEMCPDCANAWKRGEFKVVDNAA